MADADADDEDGCDADGDRVEIADRPSYGIRSDGCWTFDGGDQEEGHSHASA